MPLTVATIQAGLLAWIWFVEGQGHVPTTVWGFLTKSAAVTFAAGVAAAIGLLTSMRSMASRRRFVPIVCWMLEALTVVTLAFLAIGLVSGLLLPGGL